MRLVGDAGSCGILCDHGCDVPDRAACTVKENKLHGERTRSGYPAKNRHGDKEEI